MITENRKGRKSGPFKELAKKNFGEFITKNVILANING